MAEETKPVATDVVVISDVPEAEEKSVPCKEKEAPVSEAEVVVDGEAAKESKVVAAEGEAVAESPSFKEESNVVADLEDPEKKALDELKVLIQEALNKHEFSADPVVVAPVKEEEKKEEVEAIVVSAAEESVAPVVPVAVPETVEEAAKCEEVARTEEVPVAEVVTAAAVDNEDGTKTVEAIEETIVAVQKEAEEPRVTPAVEETKTEIAPEVEPEAPVVPPEEVSIFGIPLLADDRSDTILLKFLRARDFKVKEAFTMLKNTVRWRKEFGIDALVEEEGLGADLDKVVFMKGVDKEGHPVCYNVYGEFQDKDLYQKTFGDAEKCKNFLKWRVQFLEKSIRNLDFAPGGICTIVQINDLKNSPGPFKKELRVATSQAIHLLQDFYPEFVAKQIFINVPWWYMAFYSLITPVLTMRSTSKFVRAGPSKSAETLFKYIAPEQVPVQYGGLSKDVESVFGCDEAVTEVIIKPATKQTIEFAATETCNLVWEFRVVGWEINYGAEFVPNAEDGYTVIVEKVRRVASTTDEPVICNSFKIGEPGKVIITIDNTSSRKKKLVYRSKIKPSE